MCPGVCVENLSNQRATEPLQHISSCLHALYTLLDDPWPRRQLTSDPSLSVELLNVLHRLLLTRENLSTHQQVVGVVKQVVRAMQEKIDGQKKVKGDIQDNGERLKVKWMLLNITRSFCCGNSC